MTATISARKTIRVIGIGAGDPAYLTLQAVQAMNATDVFFLPDKGPAKNDLNHLRKALCAQVITHRNYRSLDFAVPARQAGSPDYIASVDAWRSELEGLHQHLIEHELGSGECGAFLVWGDPSLYDGTLQILRTLQTRIGGFDWHVIPGISAVQALAARHRISLNGTGENILITPGRKLPAPLPATVDNLVVMLDGHANLAKLRRQNLHMYWGANLGTAEEQLIEGPLDDVLDHVLQARLQLRESHGWIMDTSLLRRRSQPGTQATSHPDGATTVEHGR